MKSTVHGISSSKSNQLCPQLPGQGKLPDLHEVWVPAKTNGKKENGKDEAEEEALDAVDEAGEDPAQAPRDVLHQAVHLPIKAEQ